LIMGLLLFDLGLLLFDYGTAVICCQTFRM